MPRKRKALAEPSASASKKKGKEKLDPTVSDLTDILKPIAT